MVSNGIRYCPSRHFHALTPLYLAAQAGSNVGFTKPTISEISVCSGMRSLENCHPVGRMSTSDDASSSPCTCSPRGTIAATSSMLFIAPMAPALQPPNSSRCPGVEPMPYCATSDVMTALAMRAPRKLYPHVAELAGVSPLHRSELQYLTYGCRILRLRQHAQNAAISIPGTLTYTRLACAHAESARSVLKMPYCACCVAHVVELIQYCLLA